MIRPVIYQLFVRHFSNEQANGVPWGTKAQNGCGTFNGVTDKALDELVAMGVTHVWLTGVIRHATRSDYPGLPAQAASVVKGLAGSPYAITDYFDVDPDLAEDPQWRMDELENLLDRCHKKGLVPLIDFVGNHVSRAYHSLRKDYAEFGSRDDASLFFHRDNSFFYLQYGMGDGKPPFKLPSGSWERESFMARVTGNNAVTWQPSEFDWYETVKLNYGFNFLDGPGAACLLPGPTSAREYVPATWRLMDDILAFWQDKGVGGFRCDMAHMVPMAFWNWAIARARVRDRHVFFMAEGYDDHMKTTEGNPLVELLHNGFDAVYDADFYHVACNLYEQNAWANDFEAFNVNGRDMMERGVRYLENHDEPRMSSNLHWGGKGKSVMPAVCVAVLASGNGPVIIYNGQEVGEEGKGPYGFGGRDGRTSIFDYTCLPKLQKWIHGGRFDEALLDSQEKELRHFYIKFLNLLKHPALATGEFYGLNWANRQTLEYGRGADEGVSGHWAYAWLKRDKNSGRCILAVSNLSPDQECDVVRVSVPVNAWQWSGLPGDWVRLIDLLEPTNPPRIESCLEAAKSGIVFNVAPGQAALFELTPFAEKI